MPWMVKINWLEGLEWKTNIKWDQDIKWTIRPRYSHRKQVKTDYKALSLTELILNDKIKKKTKNNLSQLGWTC
jgi:hypothetical protein